MNDSFTTIDVRGVTVKLVTYTRALKLCARMNYEVEVLDFIDKMPEHSVFYDLGACEGRFSLYAALKGHQVYSFEPDPKNFKAMQDNYSLNTRSQNHWHLLPYAVAEDNYFSKLKVGQNWAGGHHKVLRSVDLRPDLNIDVKMEEDIEVVALDSFIKKRLLPLPHYLKMDIDGAEWLCLQGAQDLFLNPSLQSLIIELNPLDDTYHQCLTFLKKHRFTLLERYQVNEYLQNIVFER